MIRTRAEPDGDGWRLSGRKIWTTHVPIAEWMIALAVTDLSGNTSELSTCLGLGVSDWIHSDGFDTGWLDGWSDWSGAAP